MKRLLEAGLGRSAGQLSLFLLLRLRLTRLGRGAGIWRKRTTKISTWPSWFLPQRLRSALPRDLRLLPRFVDDLGDETGDTAQSLALLAQWREELDACYAGQARHPVFVALAETIRACRYSREPFANLLTAFVQDQTIFRYRDREGVLGYCVNSANPVGRLVLYICGYSDAERFRLSDATCSALQLANFWQDVASDYQQRGRIYLPLDAMERFGITEETIAAGEATPAFRALMREPGGRGRGRCLRPGCR